MLKRIVLLSFIAAFLLSACAIYVVDGSGNVISESRSVSNFDRVEFSGLGELIITQNGTEGLAVETDDNLMSYIETEVVDGTLHIGFTENAFSIGSGEASVLRPSSGFHFYLSVDDLTELTITGAGNVKAESLGVHSLAINVTGAGAVNIDSLVATDLSVDIPGAGSVSLAGNATSQTVVVSGVGSYRAADLASQYATVTISGAGGASVWVTDALEVNLSGAGDVDYYGSPELTRNVTGSGVVTDHGSK